MIAAPRLITLLGLFTVLGTLSAGITGGLLLAGFPAALLIGPMIAAIIVAVSGYHIPLHRRLPVIAQAVLGQLMAHSLTITVLREILTHWEIFLGGVFSVIGISFALGLLLARAGIMPGSTALWGSSPGAATAMILLCERYGADQRLVAFMLYFRVLLVTLATSLVAHMVHAPHHGLHAVHPGEGTHLWPTLIVVACAVALAPCFRHGATPLLLSMGGGLICQAGFGIHYALPYWLLAPSYVVIGWMIGRRFTREVLRHVWRTLPAVTLSTCTLILACAALAWPLSEIAHVDLLSAYLATSPGGADSIAIIAASNPIDVPFVMAMQIARFMILLLIAPGIATFLARFLITKPRVPSGQAGSNTDTG